MRGPGARRFLAAAALCAVPLAGSMPVALAEKKPEQPAECRIDEPLPLDPATFSDLYGPGGEAFRGGLGFFVGEGDTSSLPQQGFGVAIDDMVLRWRESRLDPDATDCALGYCATLQLQTTNFYEGNSRLTVTALEDSPAAANDCDLDGTPDGTNDCDGDGSPDLVARAFSESETGGEIFFLNHAGGSRYVGGLPISAVYDVPGTLFVQRQGTDLPTVTVEYEDRDDGTGNPCANDADPTKQGVVQTATNVFFPTGRVAVRAFRLTDNGDDDGFADTNETVQLFLTVINQTGSDLDELVARLSTNSPEIDCILQPVIRIGSLDGSGPGRELEGPDPFVFRVGQTVERTGEFDELAASFTVTMSSSRFDALIEPQTLTLDLDLDVTGGSGPTAFTEGFDVAGSLGSFTSMSLDFNGPGGPGGSNAASDGYRCQYNDPDFVNSNSYCPLADCQCYLGNSLHPIIPNTFDWHQHGTLQPDGGRAYSGSGSLHFGVHDASGDPDLDSTSLATLDAARTRDPINLAYAGNGGLPQLSFKHQISLVDNRGTSTPHGEAVDRGVVMAQLADPFDQAVGNWIKLYPYQNVHDAQGTDQFVDCLFDPIDDGNDEDSFFDPTDPWRRLGPSSTCFPEASFVYLGDTDHRNAFSPLAIGRASDGPGLKGSVGPGTWVESRFDLSRLQGRRIRLRFLETSIEVNDVPTYESAFQWNPTPLDDGWYVDDVRIEPTLTVPATVSVDIKDNSALPGCGNACNSLSPDLVANPTAVDAPGRVSELSAAGSSADRCVDGTLQYRFWLDGDANGALGDPADAQLRDWTDNPLLPVAPRRTTAYGAEVRCTSDPACGGSGTPAFATVTVGCPSTGSVRFSQTVVFEDESSASWPEPRVVDAIRGDLDGLRAASSGGSGDFSTSVETCLLSGVRAGGFSDPTTPAVASGFYYLVRLSACNADSWSAGAVSEVPGRDATIPSGACP